MKTIILNSNLHCGHCVRSITGFLEEIAELTSWEVDLNHPEKRIIAQGNDDLQAQKLIDAIEEAGYEAKEEMPEIS
jgi:copper chaperone CopZ